MNAECYCNFQSNLNVGSHASCFVTIGKDMSRQVAQVELRNFIGYLQQCLQRINVYFVSILVLLYTLQNSFFFSFDIVFLLFRFRFFSLYFVFLLYRISFHFVGFRFLTLQISLNFVFVSFRFFLFLSLPVPIIYMIQVHIFFLQRLVPVLWSVVQPVAYLGCTVLNSQCQCSFPGRYCITGFFTLSVITKLYITRQHRGILDHF